MRLALPYAAISHRNYPQKKNYNLIPTPAKIFSPLKKIFLTIPKFPAIPLTRPILSHQKFFLPPDLVRVLLDLYAMNRSKVALSTLGLVRVLLDWSAIMGR
jgi:hypothetical protein